MSDFWQCSHPLPLGSGGTSTIPEWVCLKIEYPINQWFIIMFPMVNCSLGVYVYVYVCMYIYIYRVFRHTQMVTRPELSSPLVWSHQRSSRHSVPLARWAVSLTKFNTHSLFKKFKRKIDKETKYQKVNDSVAFSDNWQWVKTLYPWWT